MPTHCVRPRALFSALDSGLFEGPFTAKDLSILLGKDMGATRTGTVVGLSKRHRLTELDRGGEKGHTNISF